MFNIVISCLFTDLIYCQYHSNCLCNNFKLPYTECEGKAAVTRAKLINIEELSLDFEMKDMIQKLACNAKICSMHQDNVEQLKNIENHHKDVVRPMSDLVEPLSDFIDGSRAFGDDFTLEDTEKNDNALNTGEKVSTCFAVKWDVVNYIGNNGGVMLDNSVSTTAHKNEDDGFVNGELCDSIKKNSKQRSFVSENGDEKGETVTDTELDTNIKKRGSTLEKVTISKTIRKHLQVYTCQFCSKSYKTSSRFASHLRIHTGERSYKCDVSSKRCKKNLTL